MRLVLIPLCTLIAGMSMTAYAAQASAPAPTLVAQDQVEDGNVIKGRVVDATGQGLSGVTIKVKAKKASTIQTKTANLRSSPRTNAKSSRAAASAMCRKS